MDIITELEGLKVYIARKWNVNNSDVSDILSKIDEIIKKGDEVGK